MITRSNAVPTELGTGVSPEYAKGTLFRELDAPVREWAAERITMHPSMEGPVELKSFWKLP